MCDRLSCSYKCQASLTGGMCYCPEGRVLANDSTACVGKCQTQNHVLIVADSGGGQYLKRPNL